MFKRTIFLWLTSFSTAMAGYYLLRLVLPGHHVFGAWYRMLLYHEAHPVAYIALCCFFYGLLAAAFADAFWRRGTTRGRVGIVGIIVLLTMALSTPLGGMLWYWYDMQAGYFPAHWRRILLVEGSRDGLAVGWLVVLLSVPCNVLGGAVCYFLTRTGARLFRVGTSR